MNMEALRLNVDSQIIGPNVVNGRQQHKHQFGSCERCHNLQVLKSGGLFTILVSSDLSSITPALPRDILSIEQSSIIQISELILCSQRGAPQGCLANGLQKTRDQSEFFLRWKHKVRAVASILPLLP